MKVVILVILVIGVLFAIASGVWVAVALVRAVSAPRAGVAARCGANEKDGD
jgi:uncharacterized membrane protein